MEAITQDLARVESSVAENETKLETATEANNERLIRSLELSLTRLNDEKATLLATRNQLILLQAAALVPVPIPGKNMPLAIDASIQHEVFSG